MALKKHSFTKDWTNPLDFPTFEAEETKVRADQQYLFNELLAIYNELVEELGAANLPFTPSSAVPSSNVQDAIEAVQRQIVEQSQGAVPENSISAGKLTEDSVTTEKIVDGGVTTAKLDDGAVTGAKIEDGAVTEAKLADGAVTNDKIADLTITEDKLAASVLMGFAKLIDGKINPTQRSLAWTATNQNKTLALGDAGRIVFVTNTAGTVTITVPTNASVTFPVGTEIVVFRRGEGKADVAAADGVTLLKGTDLKTVPQYGSIRLKKWEVNTWTAEVAVTDASIATAHLINKAVTTAKVDDKAITEGKLDDAAVTTAKIDNGAVIDLKLADDAVVERTIYNGAVTEDKIKNGAVTKDKLGANAVTAAHIEHGTELPTTGNFAGRLFLKKVT